MLARELEWVRMNPKGRHAKNKARIANYDKMMAEDIGAKEAILEMPIPNGPRLGTNVIDAEHVSKAFGDKLLYGDLNFKLPPAGIVGIVGPNGFFIFLLFFHSLIGFYGIYRSRVRPVVENPDSQFVAMPQSITPAGIELNPSTEPIEDPVKATAEPVVEENKPNSY